MESHDEFFVVNNNAIDMKATRKRINDFWNEYVLSDKKFKLDITRIVDTFLVLTSARVFVDEGEYGVSGLGGACGYGVK